VRPLGSMRRGGRRPRALLYAPPPAIHSAPSPSPARTVTFQPGMGGSALTRHCEPVGSARRSAPRRFKLLHDRVVVPLGGTDACELRRARGGSAGRLECWLHSDGDSSPVAVDLYCGDVQKLGG
jgi:hypothetical protein